MEDFKKFALCVGLTFAAAFIGVCLMMAFLYQVYVAYALAIGGGLAALKWLVLPLIKQGVDIAITIDNHRKQQYMLVAPDQNGNYPFLVAPSGQIVGMVPSGNAPFKQITAKGQRAIETTIEEVDDTPKSKVPALPSGTGETLFLSSDYALPADDFLSGRKLFVGTSGSGKSNSVGTYCEELGSLGVPFLLADTEDEYRPLCNPQWLTRGVLAGLDARYSVTVENAAQFGEYVLDHRLQVILNLHSYEMEEAAQVMIGIINGMKRWEEARDNEHRIPSDFILEEAVTWLPQYVRESPLHGTDTLAQLQGTFFNDMVRRGRKRGLGLTLVCQKIAELDNRAMQSDGKLLHRQTEEADLDRYKKMGINRDETLSLANGEAFLYTGRVSKLRVQIRRRNSPHGANTPGLANLRKAQSNPEITRNFGRNEEDTRNDFGTDGEPFRRLSLVSSTTQNTQKNGIADVPETTKEAILELYRQGTKRTDIQSQLALNGDEYWMIREVCNDFDQQQRRA